MSLSDKPAIVIMGIIWQIGNSSIAIFRWREAVAKRTVFHILVGSFMQNSFNHGSRPFPRKLSKPVIGLTGGIGSGKSTVARHLKSLGCAVIDADDLAHRVLKQPEVVSQLVKWWGTQVLDSQGMVDRKTLGRMVFNRPDQLKQLENLIHPKVNELRQTLRVQWVADAQTQAIVEDCPLLYEAGIDRDCDAVIFVQVSRSIQLQRLEKNRGWDEKQLLEREKNQLALDIKAKRADYVVDNEGTEANTFEQVSSVLSKIMTAYEKHSRLSS